MLLEGGEDLLGHLLLLPGAAVHGRHHIVQQADVQLLVEVQQLVNGLLSEARHLSEAPSALCKVNNKCFTSCLKFVVPPPKPKPLQSRIKCFFGLIITQSDHSIFNEEEAEGNIHSDNQTCPVSEVFKMLRILKNLDPTALSCFIHPGVETPPEQGQQVSK